MVQPTSIDVFSGGAPRTGHFIEAFSARERVQSCPTNTDWGSFGGVTRTSHFIEAFSARERVYKVAQPTSIGSLSGV